MAFAVNAPTARHRATLDTIVLHGTVAAQSQALVDDVVVPSVIAATLHARTTNGSVRNDAGLRGGSSEKRIAITAVSSNGDIVVR